MKWKREHRTPTSFSGTRSAAVPVASLVSVRLDPGIPMTSSSTTVGRAAGRPRIVEEDVTSNDDCDDDEEDARMTERHTEDFDDEEEIDDDDDDGENGDHRSSLRISDEAADIHRRHDGKPALDFAISGFETGRC